MYVVKSSQIAQALNIKAVREFMTAELVFSDSDELFYKISEEEFVYIFQFGIVSFFNVEDAKISALKKQLNNYGKGQVNDELYEDIKVYVNETKQTVAFDSVTLSRLDPEQIRLVMLYTSQSVALDRFSELTENLMEEARTHTTSLEKNGKLRISSIKLKRLIGKILNIKNSIYEHLYIFDSPEITWEDEKLAKLDAELKATFDLKNRYRNLQDRIDIIKENLALFKDIWDHKESSTLEWIIIILIFVEIVDLFITKLS